MRHSSLLIAALLVLLVPCAQAKKNPADYPLRVSLVPTSVHSHYDSSQMFKTADGDGRGNLFENSQPKAFDFSFTCTVRPVSSMGYETYMARWKKPGHVLEVLLPETGHPDNLEGCELQVILKEGKAYYRPHGMLSEESADEYKQWMIKNDYDPEHGKNTPTQPEVPSAAPPPPSGPSVAPPSGTPTARQ
jgi:hypothetical protein